MHAPGRENNWEVRKTGATTAKKERPDKTGDDERLALGLDFTRVIRTSRRVGACRPPLP